MNPGTLLRHVAIRALSAARPGPFPACLMYHSIRDDGPTLCVDRASFLSHMDWISLRRRPVALESVSSEPLSDDAIAVTFDDGYLDNYDFAVPACVERGIPVTVFLIWAALGNRDYRGGLPMMTRAQARELAAMPGVTIGSHTMSHPKLARLPREAQEAELLGSRAALEDWLGRPVRTFCYPFGSYSPATTRLVREAGYTHAVTTRIGAMHGGSPLEISRIPVNRFSQDIFPRTLSRGYLAYAASVGKS